ncbi:hypothetical protein Droror1_Dr00006209 [Drosera rotundifolia]
MGPHLLILSLLLLLLLLLLLGPAAADLTSSKSALLRLRDAVGGRTINWDVNSPPCTWYGIQCNSDNDTVIGVRLPGAKLMGRVPVGVFGELTGLEIISLRWNGLVGAVPEDLRGCVGLTTLDLQGNQFTFEIPTFVSSLTNLLHLDLSYNMFNGNVRTSLNNLTSLRSLYLDNNELNGHLPELKALQQLKEFNVSNNRLTGTIPVSLSSMPFTAFQGNYLCGKPLSVCTPIVLPGPGIVPSPPIVPSPGIVPSPVGEIKKKRLSGGAVAGIVVGCLVLFVILLMILIRVRRKKRSRESRVAEISTLRRSDTQVLMDKNGKHSVDLGVAEKPPVVPVANRHVVGAKTLVFVRRTPRAFTLEDLLSASADVLGKGTYGTTYKAALDSGPVMIVKRLKDVIVFEKEFQSRIEAVGAMEHENLAPTRAYHCSAREKFLVCDYMSMGSLSSLLHGNTGVGRSPLTWETRVRIALGAARGITYIHSQGCTVSHGNIKSSNVLITRTYEARVSDFGLNHFFSSALTASHAVGYRAPEVTDLHKVSHKADVYSFGILLLELLTGRNPAQAIINGEGIDLLTWVRSIIKEEDFTSDVFDLELLRYKHAEEEMDQLLLLAIDCTSQYPDRRPSMLEVTIWIEKLYNSSMLPDMEESPALALMEARNITSVRSNSDIS